MNVTISTSWLAFFSLLFGICLISWIFPKIVVRLQRSYHKKSAARKMKREQEKIYYLAAKEKQEKEEEQKKLKKLKELEKLFPNPWLALYQTVQKIDSNSLRTAVIKNFLVTHLEPPVGPPVDGVVRLALPLISPAAASQLVESIANNLVDLRRDAAKCVAPFVEILPTDGFKQAKVTSETFLYQAIAYGAASQEAETPSETPRPVCAAAESHNCPYKLPSGDCLGPGALKNCQYRKWSPTPATRKLIPNATLAIAAIRVAHAATAKAATPSKEETEQRFPNVDNCTLTWYVSQTEEEPTTHSQQPPSEADIKPGTTSGTLPTKGR